MNEWILVVDDDTDNLRMAGRILASQQMRAASMRSGKDALRFLESGHNRLDLILLDIHMPEMDGFQTLAEIQKRPDWKKIPVVFLTADENSGAETRGLNAGAMDFIKKPFIPEVLLTRVRRIIELTRLQNDLASQVEEKTRAVIEQQERLSRLSMQLALTLVGAVDAKDAYTNGHSRRVADYAKEMARRYGYSPERQEQIYMMGLLHDIGKIGVPDAIIGKTSPLNDEEYEIVRLHPLKGEKILRNIPDFPELSIAARWHHERYDGKGYPDGLSGDDIPEEARMIAVADAYDAMASRRSYRDVLPQERIRAEILKGVGAQFDPVFARIMLDMIDEDKEYRMRENYGALT